MVVTTTGTVSVGASRSSCARAPRPEIALEDKDRIRGFGMNGDLGPMKMDMDAVVGSHSRALKVTIPSKGVHDVTSTVVGALPGLKQPWARGRGPRG